MTKYRNGHYHAPRRKGDHHSVHYKRKNKNFTLEQIAETIVIGLSLGAFTYLAIKGHTPKMGNSYINKINQEYSDQFAPIRDNVKRIKTDISTNAF